MHGQKNGLSPKKSVDRVSAHYRNVFYEFQAFLQVIGKGREAHHFVCGTAYFLHRIKKSK